jgi:signal transduction histidine kinase
MWQARLARLAAARYARAAGVALLAAAAVGQVFAGTLTTASAPAMAGAVTGQRNGLPATPTLEQLLALALLALVATVPLAFYRPAMAALTVTVGNAVALASFGQVTAAGAAAELAAVWWLGLAGATSDLRAVRHRGLAVTPGRYLAVGLVLPFLTIALLRSGWVAVFLAAAVPAAAGLGILAWAERLARTRSAAGEALADTLLAHTARGERARIARELHDVVAHHISMIAVLAETGRLTTPGLPEAGARRFTEIGDTARAGLTEMRRLLGVLREDAAPAEEAANPDSSRQPQPGLAQLTELVDTARDASLAGTRLIISGPVTPLDPGVELAAYRIVQEALTNCRRHAPGAAVDVELRYCAESLRLRVRDNGPGPVSGAGATGPASGAVGSVPAVAGSPGTGSPGTGSPGTGLAAAGPADSGHGLAGMRERAFSVGGSLYAGVAVGGGFLIEAVLPADRDRAPVSRAADETGGHVDRANR